MQYGSILKNSAHNTAYRLLLLGQTLTDVPQPSEKVIDVKPLFPYWILDRSDGSSPTNHLVNFIQKYYDWLYSDSGYELQKTAQYPVGLRKVLDIKSTPVKFLEHFVFTYASGLSTWYIGITAGPGQTDTTQNVRSFLKGIRTNLYQQKSNEEAYRYFFESLFGKKGSDVSIDYPKKNILRLNGGRFSDWPFEGYSTGYYDDTLNLGGSYLNGDFKLQDSYWYQDFSYLIKAGVDVVDEDTGLPIYYDDIYTMLHPPGLKGFFEQTVNDYIPPGDYDGGIVHGEQPKLSNYFPYRLNVTGGTWTFVVNGTVYGGLTACVGCSGATSAPGIPAWKYNGPTAYGGWPGTTYEGVTNDGGVGRFVTGTTGGWTYGNPWSIIGSGGIGLGRDRVSDHFNTPTHVHPSWCQDIDETLDFKSIYIRDFVYLYPAEDSPNKGYTGCTAGNTYSNCYGFIGPGS